MSKFQLEMNLDNVAMASTASVADALRQVAERVQTAISGDRGLIRDYNGNTIGAWEIALDDDYADEN